MNISDQHKTKISAPRFDRPPVVETALGIQFGELMAMTTSHLGLYYSLIRDRYPFAQDQPRLAAINEMFPARTALPEFKLQLLHARPVERVWFMDKEPGETLIQIQPDRFGFNWRKPTDDAEYPSFSAQGPACIEEFERFSEFCQKEKLGEVRPNLCEVVYVNHIVPMPDRSVIDEFAAVLPGLSWESGTKWLPQPERASFNRVYVIGENQGRLYAEASIGSHKGKGDIVVLKMVGRVFCKAGDILADNLQLAHDWVVKGFECLTDPNIRRERWGQTS